MYDAHCIEYVKTKKVGISGYNTTFQEQPYIISQLCGFPALESRPVVRWDECYYHRDHRDCHPTTTTGL